MEQYKGLAEIYDSTIDVDYDKWMNFLKQYFLMKNVSIRDKWVLELGCGTGNMTLKLKENRAQVVALDISEEMLSVAEEKMRQKNYRVMLVNQNIKSFKVNKKFDFVFSFCDGYNYIIEDEEIRKSFKLVYEALNNNGYFIFDISTPYKLKEVIGTNTFTLNDDELCYIWDNYIENDILEMYITFFVKQGNMYKRLEENHLQRIYETGHIIELLEDSGFKNIEVFDDYTMNCVGNKSTRVVFAAKKEVLSSCKK